MKNALFCILLLASTSFTVHASQSSSWQHRVKQSQTNGSSLSREQIREIMLGNSDLSEEEVNAFIDRLNSVFDVEENEPLPIKGVLYTSGHNGALFLDRDVWLMDASILEPETGQILEVPDLYSVEFENSGVKLEIAYKWMFTFIPSDTSIKSLHKGTYGRGIGITLNTMLGLEGSWMPGKNREGNLFHLAIKVGLGGGLSFPKMTFTQREVL